MATADPADLPVPRPDRLRGRRPGPPRIPRTVRRHRRLRPGGVGQRRLRFPRGCVSRHGPPEPLAPGPAGGEAGPLRGVRRDLPGPRARPVEYDAGGGRHRGDRHRPPHQRRDGCRRARPVPLPPGGAPGDRGHLHPCPRRPLRRCPRRARGSGPDPRPRRLHGVGRRRERLRRGGHEPAGHVHVRRRSREGPDRSDRLRPRDGDLHGQHRTGRPDDHRDPHRPGGGPRRRAHRVPGDAGHRVPGRDELLLPRPPGPVHGGECHPQPPQPGDPARRGRPRRPGLVGLSGRGDVPLRRRHRRGLRLPPLADLGVGPGGRVPVAAARPLRLPPRPDAPAHEQRAQRRRGRRGHGAAARARSRHGTPTATTARPATT